MSSKFAMPPGGALISAPLFDQTKNVLSATFTNPGTNGAGNPMRLYIDGSSTPLLSGVTGPNGAISFALTASVLSGALSLATHTYSIQVDYTSASGASIAVTSAPVTIIGSASLTVTEGAAVASALTLTTDRAATFAMTSDNGTGATIGLSSGVLAVPALTFKRAPQQQPFDLTSFWNVPIGSSATYQQPAYIANYNGTIAGNETWSLRSSDPVGSGIGTTNAAYQTVANPAYGVYYASASDPVIPLTFQGHPQDPTQSGSQPWAGIFPDDTNPNSFYQGGTIHVHMPTGVVPMGVDLWAVIFLPDGQNYLEFEGLVVTYSNGVAVSASASYIACNNVYGRGFPGNPALPNEYDGIRAFGGSLLGGLIRASDISSGRINHAVAMLCSPGQQKYATTKTAQCQWPAYIEDGASLSLYKGVIPMGAQFAIPWSVDIETIGLQTAAGKMLARAFQEYGGYNVDTTYQTFFLANLEAAVPSSVGADMITDMSAIIKNLCFVTNNVSSAITAGGSGRPIAVGGGGTPQIAGPRAVSTSDVPTPKLSITATSTTAIPGTGTASVAISINPLDSNPLIFRSPTTFSVMENTRLGHHLYCNKPLASATLSGTDAAKFEVANYGLSGLWIRFAGDGVRTGSETYSLSVTVTDTNGVTATQTLAGTQVAQGGAANILRNATFASGDLTSWSAGPGATDSGAVTFPTGGAQLNFGGSNPWFNTSTQNAANNLYTMSIRQRIRVVPGHTYSCNFAYTSGGNGRALMEVNAGYTSSDLFYGGISAVGASNSNGSFSFTAPANQPYVYLILTAFSSTNTSADFAKFTGLVLTDTTVIPAVTAAAIANATPSTISLTFNVALSSSSVPAASAFSIADTNGSNTITAVTVSGTNVTLTKSRASTAFDAAVTVSYTPPATNPLQTSAGIQANAFSGRAVTNNVVAATQYIRLANQTALTETASGSGYNYKESAGTYVYGNSYATSAVAIPAGQDGFFTVQLHSASAGNYNLMAALVGSPTNGPYGGYLIGAYQAPTQQPYWQIVKNGTLQIAPTSQVTANAGDTVRLRRTGSTIYLEVMHSANGSSYQTIYSMADPTNGGALYLAADAGNNYNTIDLPQGSTNVA